MSTNNVAAKREQAQDRNRIIDQMVDARKRASMYQDLAKQEMLTIERLSREIENERSREGR